MPIPIRTSLQPSFGFGNDNGEEGFPDLWDQGATGRGVVHGTGRREWNLLVVNDEKVVNAMAAPGVQAHLKPSRTCDSNVIRLGTIVVFTGILPVASHEQGLAAILGHGKLNLPHMILMISLPGV